MKTLTDRTNVNAAKASIIVVLLYAKVCLLSKFLIVDNKLNQ